MIDDFQRIRTAEKRCLQTGRIRDAVEIPQLRMATAMPRLIVRDIQDPVNLPRGFDQSVMLTIFFFRKIWLNSRCSGFFRKFV